jgi:hypothetical protein
VELMETPHQAANVFVSIASKTCIQTTLTLIIGSHRFLLAVNFHLECAK